MMVKSKYKRLYFTCMSVNTKRKVTDIPFLTTHFELLKYNFFIESLKFKTTIIVLTFETLIT